MNGKEHGNYCICSRCSMRGLEGEDFIGRGIRLANFFS